MKIALEWLKALVGAVIILLVLNFFIGTTNIFNVSMEPTLYEKDMLLLFRPGGIARGDIVTFKSHLKIEARDLEHLDFFKKLFIKEGDPKILVKRVIALPGDKLDIQDGKVYINNQVLDESAYLDVSTLGEVHLEAIPEGHYFLMGDNRPNSGDSRSDEIGLVKREDITGKAILRYYPFDRFTIFKEVYK